MTRRTWLALALCTLVVLAGCQGPTQLFGESDIDETESPPSTTVTEPPTETDSTETATETPTTEVPTSTAGGDESFDPAAFRAAFRADIAETRETRGLPPLAENPAQRRVADTMARELAAVQYFENATAQNSSRFEVRRRLGQAGVACTGGEESRQDVGSGFFLKNFYQTYLETNGNISYYGTEAELARAMTTRMLLPNSTAERRQLAATVYASAATNQSVGVYRTVNDTVYVVYIVC